MTDRHESSCSRHNEPAYPNGPCDCKFRELNSHWSLFERLSEADQQRWWNQYTLYGTVFIHEDDDGNVSVPGVWLQEPKIDEALDKAVEAIRLSDQ